MASSIMMTGEAIAAIAHGGYGELRDGAERSSQRVQALDKLSRLEALISVIPLDDAVGERYGLIRAHLELDNWVA